MIGAERLACLSSGNKQPESRLFYQANQRFTFVGMILGIAFVSAWQGIAMHRDRTSLRTLRSAIAGMAHKKRNHY